MSRLLEWAMMIVANEEGARELNRLGLGLGIEAKGTNIIEFKDVQLSPSGSLTIINLSGSGLIHECLVLSKSPDIQLTISVDGSLIFDKTFNESLEVSQELIFLSAFTKEENGQTYYVMHVKGIEFRESINISVKNTSESTITISRVVCKYSQ